jgi:DNA-binding IclR family transcriptional regulator
MANMTAPFSPSAPLAARVRAEYSEAPGLRLTLEQASRFLGIDPPTCERALEELEREGFLWRCADGRYQRRIGR